MQAVTESRFYMWRAVFAFAHLDGEVSSQEVDFIENYLEYTPFSEEQKTTIREDIVTPQNVNEMLIGISATEDQADFFQFAQMMAWADGSLDDTEKKLIERLSAEQMNRFNKEEIAQNIRQTRKAAQVRRALEDKEFKKQAKDVVGISNMIRFVAPWMQMRDFNAPDQKTFGLWRAVFALSHADGVVSVEEKGYIEGMMEVFKFSSKQRQIIEDDLSSQPNIEELFAALDTAECKRQFFIMAKNIVWCDGEFHEQEKRVLDNIVAGLGEEAHEYDDVLQELDNKPLMPEGDELETGEEKLLKNVVQQMVDFYKDNPKKAA